MESIVEVLIIALFWVYIAQTHPIRLTEGIGLNGRGRISNLVRNYLYLKNFENVMRRGDKSAKLVKTSNRMAPEMTRENILKAWRDVYDIKEDEHENRLKNWLSECRCKATYLPTLEDILAYEELLKGWKDSTNYKPPASRSVDDILAQAPASLLKACKNACTNCKAINNPQSPPLVDMLAHEELLKGWKDSTNYKTPASISVDEILAHAHPSVLKACKNACTNCKANNNPQSPLDEELIRKTVLKTWKDVFESKSATPLPPLENVLTRELILKTWKDAFDCKTQTALPPSDEELARKYFLKAWKQVLDSKLTPPHIFHPYQRIRTHVKKPGYQSAIKTNIILLPMLNVVADPDKATDILKALGVEDAPTIYPDGKFDFYRNRNKLSSIFALPILNQPSNTEPVWKPEEEIKPEAVDCMCEYTNENTQAKRHIYDDIIQQSSDLKHNSLPFPNNSAPENKEWEMSNSKEFNYDGDVSSSELIKMLMYLKKTEEPVTFSKAVEICSKRGMTLPIIRSQLDLAELSEAAENERDYWIGLGKSECQTGDCLYRWLDGGKDTRFIRQFESELLKPKTGPIEFCTIRFRRQKTLVKCFPGTEATAYYICTRNKT